jgi:hypothetical protein
MDCLRVLDEFQIGDVWIVYGWKTMAEYPTGYPPSRI